jgi:hypothetical protein
MSLPPSPGTSIERMTEFLFLLLEAFYVVVGGVRLKPVKNKIRKKASKSQVVTLPWEDIILPYSYSEKVAKPCKGKDIKDMLAKQDNTRPS